ncbi:YheC/D like ATP-grasp [Carboxydocella sporoproducens DSM 16521]|uniref:YheC/D like ATP-grasp n=2 Tax=Carboxydocella TaxID=178898 RepID=A0A1T4PPM5_9FIRM|nr:MULTISPECIES: YheC/YheD family protein [Carboxydocella]AVX19701.1 YheC/D like ATP-grasp [Carboxydocella thermautotrophica]SJZ93555.1 YheC/D like ATP-grasp [Carboxydocella sporoproducens DSM 16521]
MQVRLKSIPDHKNTVCISKAFAVKVGIAERIRTYLKFGRNFTEIKIVLEGKYNDEIIGISENVLQKLAIPLFCDYEILVKEHCIELGPFVGILAGYTESNVAKRRKFFLNYTSCYHKINGVILLFSLEQIDRQLEKVNAFIYNPQKKDWEKGMTGIPAVIFKKIRLSQQWRDFLVNNTGGYVFNDYVPDKYEVYLWLRDEQEIVNVINIPETIKLTSKHQLINMVAKFSELMLKPIKGSQGKGIEVINQNNYNEYINQKIYSGNYILQQRITLLNIENSIVDFRLILVKNEKGYWEPMDLIVRLGDPGKAVSNVSAGGKALDYCQFIERYQVGERLKAVNFKETLSQIALLIANSIVKKGIHLGNLGIDFALDEKLDLWLIEVNSLDPNHTIVMDAGKDRSALQKIYYKNMAYARFLAGY